MPLHLTMAFLALVGIVLGFTRTTFISVGLILPLLTLRPRFLRRVAPVVPLLLPLLVLGVVLVPKVYPTAVSTFSKRISLSPKDDLSIEWRHRASAAVWEQVHESPLFGVGFGRIVYFQPPTVNGPGLIPVFEPIQQDAHNGQLWLLASGGVALLGAFWLVLVSYASDLRGRLRHATEAHEIVLVQWAGVTALSFVLNTFTSPSLGATPTLLTLWTMLLLPAAVVSRPVMRRAASLSATRTRTRRLGVLAPADSP
jgi:O-antigen ligase